MKTVIKTALAFSALAALAGCGLRGDLERPPPIFSDPPSEEAQTPVDSPAVFAQAPIDQFRSYFYSLVGEIPKPSPDADFYDVSMS